ncbi:hypothetical protein KUL49_19700 [Alteromonas sp. KUL49]|nr:hypothetical protein KUL49_19700 [Alteromonas sp. KUL49]
MNELKAIIEEAFENRDQISPDAAPQEVKQAVADAIAMLNRGEARVAEKIAGEWVVHQWLKKAVLLFSVYTITKLSMALRAAFTIRFH